MNVLKFIFYFIESQLQTKLKITEDALKVYNLDV